MTGTSDNVRTRRYAAPGRVNLIGEHTDYNDGFVLPTNTGLYTRVTAAARDDRRISAEATVFGETAAFELDNAATMQSGGWISYVQGVAAMLMQDGARLCGATLRIEGELPLGGGLSSSASLELAVAAALLGIAGEERPAPRIAALCRDAERRYAGVNCGIMDQYSIACGKMGAAMLLDCRSMATTFVAIPDSVALLVIDSGVKHQLPDSGYNDRASECESALRILNKAGVAADSLRDVSPSEADACRDQLGDVLHRRCRHVITENQRVLDAVDTLQRNDPLRLGELVNSSHRSLRDDYEVSCREVDELVTIANGCEGVFGSRMVGAGFGGCVLVVTDPDRLDEVESGIASRYGEFRGERPWTHRVTATDAAGEITDR
jgi:galactokinase